MARRPLRNAQSGTGKKRPGKEVTKRENFSKSSLDFCDFIAGEARPSSDPHVEDEHAPKYVPYCVLRKYWESDSCEKIKEVFREQKLYFTIDTIRSRYLRTFSLLVYTGQIQHLAQFTAHNLSDAKLPLSDCPVEWPTKTPLFGSLWDSISREQWMFFPLAVDTHQLEDVHLDGRVVVPISRREGIISGNAASVEIVTIHDRCNFSTDGSCLRSFALKTYFTETSKHTYENEIRALRMFTNYPSDNIVKYHGSYRQHGTHNKPETYNIILERIEEGNLSDYLKRKPPPEGKDVRCFWRSVSQVLLGLERIHHLVEGNSEVFGMHEDIKPDNILISSNAKPLETEYDFTPKIVDFGLFSRVTRSISSSSTAMGSSTQGNRLYSSPESSSNELYSQKGPVMVTPKADVFSMAAVLSAACAWVAGGRELQKSYTARRKAYHDGLPKFANNSFKGCFHDGHVCIPTVYEVHDEIREICKERSDKITPKVLDILETNVFKREKASDRAAARDLFIELKDLLQEASPRHGSDDDDDDTEYSADTASIFPEDGSLEAVGRGMTVTQLASYRKDQVKADPRIKALVDLLKANIFIRDHFFLIDDSPSMKQHVHLIKDALQELFAITKDLDPNKVELAFASAPTVITKTSWRTKKLLDAVERNPFRRESDKMDFFPQLLDEVIKPRLPRVVCGFDINFKARLRGREPISIYVLTDGNWGHNAGPGSVHKKPLEEFIKFMQQQKVTKKHVTFHFVRFGDNELGKRYLNHLDRFGQNLDGWDIVDVKDLVDAEVHKIILGPLSPYYDGMGEDD